MMWINADDKTITTKVVITGGGGFLGQILAREILTTRGSRLRCGSFTGVKVVEMVLT